MVVVTQYLGLFHAAVGLVIGTELAPKEGQSADNLGHNSRCVDLFGFLGKEMSPVLQTQSSRVMLASDLC
jgi:hypothetical protein